MSSLARSRIAQTAMACALVLLVALVLLAADADLAVAEIVLMLAVVGASVLGYRVGLVVAIEAFVLFSARCPGEADRASLPLAGGA
jgi:hypothetical protein